MRRPSTTRPGPRAWLAAVLVVAIAALAAACRVDVVLGVDPGSDAAVVDAGDAGAGG